MATDNNNDNSNSSKDSIDATISEAERKELQEIRDALVMLNNHKLVRNLNSTRRMIGLQFLRGVAFGLGSVIGATIVVSLLISFLAQIEFIPIIGEWAVEIIREIKPNITIPPPSEVSPEPTAPANVPPDT